MKHIPNIITLGNLISGAIACITLLFGYIELSVYLVLFAGVLDLLDGLVARLLKAHSEIGKELDSLADVISFGLYPGIVVFKLYQYSFTNSFEPPNIANFTVIELVAMFSGLLVTAFSALRLATFNTDNSQSEEFKGLPVPANALFFASVLYALYNERFQISNSALSLVSIMTLTLLSGFLLVSSLRLLALKFNSFKFKGNEWKYSLIILSTLIFIYTGIEGISLIIILYILISILHSTFNKNKTTLK